ncbi:MAG: Hpt domain-containing protein [Solobacterium sp.]|nr:Hpt domain-containing protein [Solobacterium sp.]
MITLEKLAAYGADTKTGLERCMNNEAFYLRLVGMILKEKSFDALEKAIAENNLRAAFEAAHALKGVAGNLALTPLYEPASEMTELLRAETQTDYSGYMKKILEQKALLEKMNEE